MKKQTIIIIAVVIVLIIIFFWPKQASEGPYSLIENDRLEHPDFNYYEITECNCIGFIQYTGHQKSIDSICYGIPSCEDICRQRTNDTWTNVECE